MSNDNQASRKRFLKQIGATSFAAAAFPLQSLFAREKAEERILRYEKKISSGEKIN